jgi:threonine synthase
MAMPTNGNAGAALAAYCTRCGIEAYTFAPEDTPECNIREMDIQGAKVCVVPVHCSHAPNRF